MKNNKVIRITIIGGIVDFILAIFKLMMGFFGNSVAMIADGLHSFSDLISDGITLFAAKHSNNAPDKEHPYGHKRFETLATLALSAILFLVGLWILFEAISGFFNPKILDNYFWLIVVASISILSKELLFWLTIIVAKKNNSTMLRANAWHHRTDALSSIAVLIGIIASFYNIYYADSIAAIIVAIMIIYMSFELGIPAAKELVDTTIASDKINKLTTEISKISGVVGVHMLRARSNAGNISMDAHIQVEPKLSVSEGHIISVSVERVAKKCCKELDDIIVHIDPEDDEKYSPNEHLPERSQALGVINKEIFNSKLDKFIVDITLHYLFGKISIDFYLTLDSLEHNNKKVILKELKNLFNKYEYFDKIEVLFK